MFWEEAPGELPIPVEVLPVPALPLIPPVDPAAPPAAPPPPPPPWANAADVSIEAVRIDTTSFLLTIHLD